MKKYFNATFKCISFRYFLDSKTQYASEFMDCTYMYGIENPEIVCVCNSQLCNGLNEETLLNYINHAPIQNHKTIQEILLFVFLLHLISNTK